MRKNYKAPKVIAGARAILKVDGEVIGYVGDVSLLGKHVNINRSKIRLVKGATLKDLEKSVATIIDPIKDEEIKKINLNSCDLSYSIPFRELARMEQEAKETANRETFLEEPIKENIINEDEDEDEDEEEIITKSTKKIKEDS